MKSLITLFGDERGEQRRRDGELELKLETKGGKEGERWNEPMEDGVFVALRQVVDPVGSRRE